MERWHKNYCLLLVLKIIQRNLDPTVSPDDVDVETPLQIAGS